MSINLRSRRRVYQIIELVDTQVSKDQIKEYLEKNKNDLLQHLQFYQPFDSLVGNNNNDPKKQKVLTELPNLSSSEKDFIVKAAKYMDLNVGSTYQMLEGLLWQRIKYPDLKSWSSLSSQSSSSSTTSFLAHSKDATSTTTASYTNTNKNFLSSIVSDKIEFNSNLIDEMNMYFFGEQEATLLLWSALLRAAEDPAHPFFEPIQVFIKECFPNHATAKPFVDSLLNQLTTLQYKPIPSSILSSPEHASQWTLHYLNLQLDILNVLFFLYYTQLTCPADQAVQIFDTLSKFRFGLEQANQSLFTTECTTVWHNTVRLMILLCINILNLELSMDNDEKMTDEISNTWLQSNCLQLSSLVNIAKNLTSSSRTADVYSPLILAIGALTTHCGQASSSSEESSELFDLGPQLVQFAIKAGVFKFLNRLCSTQLLAQPAIRLAYKSVLKGLLMLFVKLYPINSVSDDESIFEFTSALFKDAPELAAQFWEQDFPISECRDILTTCRLRFPLIFRPFIRLVNSLIGDVHTALYAIRYLHSSPNFCDLLEDERYMPTMEKHTYEFTSSHLLKSNGLNLAIPTQTKARLIAANVVSLQYRFSIWHYLLCLMDAFVYGESIQVQDIEDALSLISNLLECGGDSLYEKYKEHILEFVDLNKMYSIYGNVMDKACENLTVYHSIVAKILRHWKLLYTFEPDLVIRKLQNTSFLPSVSSVTNMRSTLTLSQRTGKTGIYLQDAILPFEKTKGTFPITLAYIELMTTILSNSDEEEQERIFPSIEFIVREIWCHYGRWRVLDPDESIQTGKALLSLLNTCLRLSKKELDTCQQWIVSQFVWSGDRGFTDPLFCLITTGYDDCRSLYTGHQFSRAYKREQLAVQALMFLKFLLIHKTKLDDFSPMENRILDFIVNEGKSNEREMMLVLGLSVLYSFNRQIPTLATQILTLLLRSAVDSRTVFSLLGFFGQHVDTLVPGYVELAMYDNDVDLPVAIYEFWKQMCQSQLSLAMVFFNDKALSSDITSSSTATNLFKNKLQEASKDKSTILTCVLHHLKQCDQLVNSNPRLLASLMDFICSLWHRPAETRQFIEKLKSESLFWDVLIKLIPCEIEMPGNVIQHAIEWVDEGKYTVSVESQDVKLCSYLMLAKCSAMRTLALDLFILAQQQQKNQINMNYTATTTTTAAVGDMNNSINKEHQQKLAMDKLSANQKKALTLLSSQFDTWFARDTGLIFDVSWFNQVKEQVSTFFENKHRLGEFRFFLATAGDRAYGDHYFYDVPLLMNRIVKRAGVSSESELHDVQATLFTLNHMWSVTDAQLVAIRSWGFCLQTLMSCCCLDMFLPQNGGQQQRQKQQNQNKMQSFLKQLVDLITRQQQSSYPFNVYTNELSILAHVFCRTWVQLNPTTEELVDVFSSIVSLMNSQAFPVNESANLKQDMHEHWAGILLYVLMKLNHVDKKSLEAYQGGLSQELTQLAPALAQGLSSLLQWRLSVIQETGISEESKNNIVSDGYVASNTFEHKPSSSLPGQTFLQELTSRLRLWIHVLKSLVLFMEKNQFRFNHLIHAIQKEDLLTNFLSLFSVLMRAYKSDHINPIGHQQQQQPDILVEELLGLFCVLASSRDFAFILVHQGIMTVLLNTDMVPDLSEGLIEPYFSTEMNGWHTAWCHTLQVLTPLLTTIGTDQRQQGLTSSILNIMSQQFWQQVERVLDMSQEPCLTIGKLNEIHSLTRLFWCFADEKIKIKEEWVNITQQIGYQTLICRIIKYFVFLLDHPRLLSARLLPVTSIEREGSQNHVTSVANATTTTTTSATDDADASGGASSYVAKSTKEDRFKSQTQEIDVRKKDMVSSQLAMEAKLKMFDILRTCGHHLRVSTGAEQLMHATCKSWSSVSYTSTMFVSLWNNTWFSVNDLIEMATILYEDQRQRRGGKSVPNINGTGATSLSTIDDSNDFLDEMDDGSVESVLLVILYEYLHVRDRIVREELVSFMKSHTSPIPSFMISIQKLL